MSEQAAMARARWLAEVSAALEQARRLAQEVRESAAGGPDSAELIARIETARRAIRALQLRGQRMPIGFPPEWSHPSGSEATPSDLG